jgi:hypothetical protein
MATVDNKLAIKMNSLVPDQSAFKDVFTLGALPVDVAITITTKGLVTAKKYSTEEMKKHFGPTAEKIIGDYEKTVTTELGKLAAKVRALKKNGGNGTADAERMVAETTLSVTNALASLQGAISTAIAAQVKTEAQRDANLKEARAVTAAKVGKITIVIAAAVTKLVATSGADVTSYIAIATELKGAYDELRQQLKGEKQLAGDVAQALAEAKLAGPQKQADAVAKAETARKKYRNHLTKYLEQMGSIGKSADKLTVAMKQAKTLNTGVEIGAQAMAVKRQCTALQAKYVDGTKQLDDMGALIKQLGGKVDDRTALEKLLTLDKETIIAAAKAAKDAASLAKTGEELVTTIIALA